MNSDLSISAHFSNEKTLTDYGGITSISDRRSDIVYLEYSIYLSYIVNYF